MNRCCFTFEGKLYRSRNKRLSVVVAVQDTERKLTEYKTELVTSQQAAALAMDPLKELQSTCNKLTEASRWIARVCCVQVHLYVSGTD